MYYELFFFAVSRFSVIQVCWLFLHVAPCNTNQMNVLLPADYIFLYYTLVLHKLLDLVIADLHIHPPPPCSCAINEQ